MSSNGRVQRFAFTLVELLVVIAIIGVLVGLLLPAVQMVREAARRTDCSNKVRQLSLALMNFESAQQELPPGLNSGVSEGYAQMSWQTRCLPFLERNAVWQQAVRDYKNELIPFYQHAGMVTVIESFGCTSDPSSGQLHWTHQDLQVATTSYLGVNGTNYLAEDGIFYKDSRTKFRDIEDGQSNTLMIGERPPSIDFWYGWWYAGVGQAGSGSPDMLLGVAELNDPAAGGEESYLEECPRGPYRFEHGNRSQCDTLHFWSYHPGGGHFGLADGSVRFVAYDIGIETMAGLATISGGEVVDFSNF